MRPVDCESQTVTIKQQAYFCAENPELGNDGLCHIKLDDAAIPWLKALHGVSQVAAAGQISQFAIEATRAFAFPNAILQKLRA